MADPTPDTTKETGTRGPLLDLETLTVRSFVRIDGVPYELRNRGELPLLADKWLVAQWQRCDVLLKTASPTAEDEREFSETLKRICARMLDAPPDVLDRLDDAQRIKIAETFLGLRWPVLLPTGAMPMEATPSLIGASSDPSSPASTGAP